MRELFLWRRELPMSFVVLSFYILRIPRHTNELHWAARYLTSAVFEEDGADNLPRRRRGLPFVAEFRRTRLSVFISRGAELCIYLRD